MAERSGLYVVTVCSRAKRIDPEPLPALERYTGTHIGHLYDIAQQRKTGFLILSGKYGLLKPDEMVMNYDYRLEASAVTPLVHTIANRLEALGIDAVEFYTKPHWSPYTDAMCEATELVGISLEIEAAV